MSLFCKQGFRDTKAFFCLLGKLPNPLRTLPAASGCASVPDALTAVPAKEKSPVQNEHYTHTAPDFPSSTTLSIFFFLPHFLLMQLLFFLLVPFQDFFATMSSDEFKNGQKNSPSPGRRRTIMLLFSCHLDFSHKIISNPDFLFLFPINFWDFTSQNMAN